MGAVSQQLVADKYACERHIVVDDCLLVDGLAIKGKAPNPPSKAGVEVG